MRMTMKQIEAIAKRTGQVIDLPPPKVQEVRHPEGTTLERTFAQRWRELAPTGIPAPVREYQFDESRGSRFDFCWPNLKIVVECEGYDHRMTATYRKDIEKYNRASLQSWTLFRCTTALMEEDPAGFVEMVVAAIYAAADKGE